MHTVLAFQSLTEGMIKKLSNRVKIINMRND